MTRGYAIFSTCGFCRSDVWDLPRFPTDPRFLPRRGRGPPPSSRRSDSQSQSRSVLKTDARVSVIHPPATMQLRKISIVLLLTALAALARASTTFPETTSFEVSTTEVTTSSEDVTTTDTAEPSVQTEGTTIESLDHTTTADELYTQTITDRIADGETSGTTETSAVTQGEAVDSSTPAEEEAKKEDVPEVAETTTPTERKPVNEPPFIKKFWPLLCFKTKCDRRHAAPVIPKIDAPEVRTDLEESRSSGDVLRAIEAEMVGVTTTTEGSSEEEDKHEKEKKSKGEGSNESTESKDDDEDGDDNDDDDDDDD
uniref:Uncharacterized protein n=1 Tax=Lygus hesperus TaxID=30085 RepID=A0A0A9YSX0_LYGHE